jgi:hypothetical protein
MSDRRLPVVAKRLSTRLVSRFATFDRDVKVDRHTLPDCGHLAVLYGDNGNVSERGWLVPRSFATPVLQVDRPIHGERSDGDRWESVDHTLTEITGLVNARHQNGRRVRIDGEPTRRVARAFKSLADNITKSLKKGDRVIVHGTVTTDTCDRQGHRRQTHCEARVLQRLSSSSLLSRSSASERIVRGPSARRSRARTQEVISMIASIVGVGTPRRRARSVKKTRV